MKVRDNTLPLLAEYARSGRVVVFDTGHMRPDLKSHALANLIEVLGIDGVNSHDALDDALACAEVFFSLLAGL